MRASIAHEKFHEVIKKRYGGEVPIWKLRGYVRMRITVLGKENWWVFLQEMEDLDMIKTNCNTVKIL